MRKIVYHLSDGRTVTSLAQAQASGKSYTISCQPIAEEVHMSERQRARRLKIK